MKQILGMALIFGLHLSNARPPATVLIETKYGKVEGDLIKVPEADVIVSTFKGIPCGIARRFQKPEPVKPWKGVLKARNWGNNCYQHRLDGKANRIDEDTSEDCLYLNVFAPYKNDGLRPVVVFIHGGAFAFGSSTQYGQEGIINWMVPKGVIVITINYRLGPWGFFSTGTKDAPGNYGLWDQTMALRWIRENIDRFGGDPNRVTIFGQSAGAASVALLALSPHSRNLFQQSIVMSGSSYLFFLSIFNESTQKAGQLLSTALDCGSVQNGQDAEAIVECLKKKSSSEILKGLTSFTALSMNKVEFLGFVPVFDGDFFPEPLDKLRASAPLKPMICGVTSDEIGGNLFNNLRLSDMQQFTIDDFSKILHVFFPEKTYYEYTPLVHSLALHHYMDSVGDRRNSSFVLQQYKTLFSDFSMGNPGYKEALDWHKRGSKVWLYVFDYYDHALFPKDSKHKGSHHGLELPYLFKMDPIHHPSPFEGNDKTVKDIMTTLWTNFAIYGQPNPEQSPFHTNFTWEPISDQHPSRYLNIGLQSEQRDLYNRQMVSFWHELLPKVLKQVPDSCQKGRRT